MKYYRAELNDIFVLDGHLVKVIGIAEGKTICMQRLEVDNETCPHCGKTFKRQIEMLESCPNFQNGVEPINTLKS